ncbi:MAG: TetR/AcrR family transcriptional regulator [Oligoflexus sp.]
MVNLRKEEDFRRRETELLQIAHQLFREQGPSKVSVESIAQKLGVAKGTVYLHVRSKHEIFALLCISYLTDLEEKLKVLDRKRSIQSQIRFLCRSYFEFCFADLARYKTYSILRNAIDIKALREPIQQRYYDRFRSLKLFVMNIIEDGLQQGVLPEANPDQLFVLGLGLLDGTLETLVKSPFEIKIDDIASFFDLAETVLTRALILVEEGAVVERGCA